MVTILATIFVFGIIVLIHELGHFVTAKMFNMQVDEFAIGFGPTVIAKKQGETLYSLRAIPLGGFNKIAGMSQDESLNERSFIYQPVWKRFIVIAAGAVMNFILAIVLFWGIFFFNGVQSPSNEAIIGGLVPHGPAEQVGLQANDKILFINGTPIATWTDIHKSLANRGELMTSITIERNGQVIKEEILPQYAKDHKAYIGIYPIVTTKQLTFSESCIYAVSNTVEIMYQMTIGLAKVLFGKASANLAGPIGVAKMAGEVAHLGFIALLSFTALLSVNLGVINLLPLPVLDGGHLIMLLIEGITGKKMSSKILYRIQLVGIAVLGIIFFYATYSDIIHIFK